MTTTPDHGDPAAGADAGSGELPASAWAEQVAKFANGSVAWLARDRHLRGQMLLLFFLALFAGGTLTAPFLANSLLCNDRLTLFSFFRDTLHSLNVHGEYPWWNPNVQMGFPVYYISILGWTGLTPLFVLTCAVFRLLGVLGITVQHYLSFYIVYFGILVPMLLTFSMFALLRKIVHRPACIYVMLPLLAFCPGVVFSISDSGVELTAYGFLFCAAVLHFVDTEGRCGVGLPLAALFALCVCFNHLFLYWNLVFLPMAVAAFWFVPDAQRMRAWEALKTVRARHWAWCILGVLVCVAPALLTYWDGSEIVRSTTGTRAYSFWRLRPGNPLEFLTASIPGIGYEWDDYASPAASFTARFLSREPLFMSYGYAGMLTLPLAVVGLCFGSSKWRLRVLTVLMLLVTVILLSGYSPVFAVLLAPDSPLRAVNHYSDTTYRLGGFFVLLMAAALGLERLVEWPRRYRSYFALAFCGWGVATVVLLSVLPGYPRDFYLTGFIVAMFAFLALLLVNWAQCSNRYTDRTVLILLGLLLLVDVSTCAYAHVRFVLLRPPHAETIREPGPEAIGLPPGEASSRAHTLLHLQGLDARYATRLAGSVPYLGLYDASRPVLLPVELPGHITPLVQTYNRLEVAVNSPQPCRLIWRDAHFRHWRAYLNGRNVPLERGLEHFKAVRLPEGNARVEFRFAPAALRTAIVAAYLLIALTTVWAMYRSRACCA